MSVLRFFSCGSWKSYYTRVFQAVLVIGLLLSLSSQVSAFQGYPVPSKVVSGDYYVSWTQGSNSNPGTFSKPFKTPDKAVQVLKTLGDPSGKIVLIRGGKYRVRDDSGNRLNISNLNGSLGAPIEIRGYPGEEVILDSFTADFDPSTMKQVPVGWGGISINKSSHIIFENFKVMGRSQANIELLDSDYITIRFCEASRSNKHGLFTGGSFHHLTIEACKFYEHMYGSTASHGIYVSGGHWDPNKAPVRDVVIRYCESYYNGRHGFQFNGRGENITIENNTFHHNVLGGISLIGPRKVSVKNNLIYKNNKQGVILFTYLDGAYWDPNDPISLAHWKATHWTIEDVVIENNTIFMDDTPWYDDEWINYHPEYHAGVYLVDTSGLLPPYDDIVIRKNIIYNHSKSVVNFANKAHFAGTSVYDNFFLASGEPEAAGYEGFKPVPHLESAYPIKWHDNVCGADPAFVNLTPTKLIDKSYKLLDFSDPQYTKFDDNFLLQNNSPVWAVNAGAFLNATSVAKTLVKSEVHQLIPKGYGENILRLMTSYKVKPEMQNWFFSVFNPRNYCLKDLHRVDGRERLCFKMRNHNVIAFAIYNDDPSPLQVMTSILSKKNGGMTILDCFGASFDANLDLKITKHLKIENATIDQVLDQNCLGVFVVLYKEEVIK